jgi:cyclophilin family peptidyl-prolyl cis-trans isomerase
MAKQYTEFPATIIDPGKEYKATIKTSMGDIVLELFPKQAPNTVNSFVFLSQDDYYDGIIFHRVIPQFMIQGGDPTGTGTGGPGYQFADEIVSELVFDRPGLLAMANRGGGTGTNSSQFFITTAPTPHLNGSHTIFGSVKEGQDVVEAISRVPRDGGDKPQEDVTINDIEISTE